MTTTDMDLKILVVDDEDSMLSLIQSTLMHMHM